MKEKLKTIGYLLFAWNYWLCTLMCKRKEEKVFGIMTHDSSKESNVGMVLEELSREEDYEIIRLKRGDEKKLSFYFGKSYHLATASCVLQDNVFLPMAYLRFPKEVKVIQLWHGTGTIKKFGQDYNTGRLKKLEARANEAITHMIVNAQGMAWLYQSAFGIPAEKIYALGLPRTDALFDEKQREKNRAGFYAAYPALREKKLLLYTPTFRDKEAKNPQVMLDLELLLTRLPDEYAVGLRLHPFVAAAFHEEQYQKNFGSRLVNLSRFPDINTLYEVSTALITDYSSVIFDYCILDKPIYFYAYDLDDFLQDGRGTYVDYKKDMPGPIAYTTGELCELLLAEIREHSYDYERLSRFKKESYQYFDGRSTKRVVELLKEK